MNVKLPPDEAAKQNKLENENCVICTYMTLSTHIFIFVNYFYPLIFVQFDKQSNSKLLNIRVFMVVGLFPKSYPLAVFTEAY